MFQKFLSNKHIKHTAMTFESKQSLAQKYFPYISPRSATNKLMSLINDNTTLIAQLADAGYTSKQRHFSPLQLEAIYSTFGKP